MYLLHNIHYATNHVHFQLNLMITVTRYVKATPQLSRLAAASPPAPQRHILPATAFVMKTIIFL